MIFFFGRNEGNLAGAEGCENTIGMERLLCSFTHTIEQVCKKRAQFEVYSRCRLENSQLAWTCHDEESAHQKCEHNEFLRRSRIQEKLQKRNATS